MYKIAKPFFIKVITPLHAGSGQDLGIVDMPIQRERHTGFPKIEGSGLKGCIREAFGESTGEISVGSAKVNDSNRKDTISLAFGPEEGDLHAGALGFTDARILLFPVKSMKGIFAYITCPMVLGKFQNDLELAGISNIPQMPAENTVSSGRQLFVKDNKIVLEEYTFDVKQELTATKFADWLSKWLNINEIQNKLVVLSNDDFRDFVNLSTEVITRTKISPETGTAAQGALFTEEYLPVESILYSLALTTPIFKEKKEDKGIFAQDGKTEEDLVMQYFAKGLPEIIQIGGNATIGKGIVRTKA